MSRDVLTRRQALAVGAGAAVGSAVLPRAWFRSPQRDATPVDDESWPTNRHDPARTGTAPGGDGPTHTPSVRWRATLPDDSPAWSWVVVAGDTVYAATDRTVTAFTADGGTQRWQTSGFGTLPWRPNPLRLDTSPNHGAGRLVVGSGTSLYAVDTATGAAHWQYKTSSDVDRMLCAGATAYVSSIVGSTERLVALDVDSGIERWRTAAGTGVHPAAAASGLVVGSAVDDEQSLGAVDVETGQRRWTRDIGATETHLGGPCIADGTVFHGGESLSALRLSDGEPRWTRTLGATGRGVEPVSNGDVVYLTLGGPGRIVALAADSGETLWRVDHAGVVGGSGPALVGETLYVGLEHGVLALDAASGAEQFRIRRPETANVQNAPVVVDGTLYFVLDRTLYAYSDDE